MASPDVDMLDELSEYSGLNSFNQNALEKELEMCKKLGADVNKLKALNFNALQLAEIRKGIESNIDYSKYMNPKMAWTEMEELRLEMSQGIDMSGYRAKGFDVLQISQIRQGLAAGIDVSAYAKKEYLADQMREIRHGLSKKQPVPIIFFQDPAFDSRQMHEIRKGLEAGIDISNYASVTIPYMKMRIVRESAEDGLYFDEKQILAHDANVLDQIHKAFVDGIDINRYVRERFDAEQLEEIRLSIKEGLPINDYITGDMRGDTIKEIRLGLENGIDVTKYADSVYNWMQMYEMRIGLEHQIDITSYCKPLYRADQMREIRLGLEEGLDISRFSSMMYTAKDMRRIREGMLSGTYKAVVEDDSDVAKNALDRTAGVKDSKVLLDSMMENRDIYLSFTSGNLLAWLKLPLRSDGLHYTEDVILAFLFKCNVRKGVDKQEITKMIANLNHNEKYLVAAGKEAVDGKDGYYEYFFDTELGEEPEILEDGTADLTNMDSIVQVHVGDKIAVYHKATKGQDGYDVFGKVKPAKNGKEIPILKGEGFMILNDKVTYVAKWTGALTMPDGNIKIQKILVMPEVRITDKKINYDGVVYVKGDVHSGSEIVASSDIIIGGHMESSEIKSGGNVVIKGGATCPIRGSITAVGNVSAKFFEGVTVVANEVSANFFINCNITAKGFIRTYGRAGIIYGGTCHSTYGIEVASIGNKSGAKTVVNLGVDSALLSEYSVLKKKISREEEDYRALAKERDRLQEIGAVDRQIMQWKVKINAAVGVKENNLKELRKQQYKFEEEIKKGGNAQAVVTEMAYAGTVFVIDGLVYRLDSDRRTYDKMIFRSDSKKEKILVL